MTNPPDWAVNTKADQLALSQGCYWDAAQADAIIKFAEGKYRSQFIKGPITLREEQRRFLSQLYGWRLADGRRRFRFVTLHVPKKSYGKSLVLCIVAAFELLLSCEPSPVIMAGAATRENAGALYKEIAFALKAAGMGPFTKFRDASKKLEIPGLNASLECVSKFGHSAHGPNASLVLLDEAHVMHSSLFNALKYATAARLNGFVLLASTAGDDVNHWYHAIYAKSKRIISGEDEDITHLSFVCEADPDADHELDEAQWKLANPNLGSPECPIDTFRNELKAARATGLGEWLNFKKLRLNVWVRPSEHAYFDCSAFERYAIDPPTDDELKGHRCAIGVDLSQKGDPTSVTILWDRGDHVFIRSKAWVCREGDEERKKTALPLFDQFPEVEVTDGSMIDYKLTRDYVLDLCDKFTPQAVYFDPTSAFVMMNEIALEGYTAKSIPQTYRYFNPAMTEFQRAWDEGRIRHDGSSWLRYCFANVRIDLNARTGEVRPNRARSVDKIDGAVSTLIGFLGLISEGTSSATVTAI